VFAGDLVDRGPDVLQLLWFVHRLEREAEAAGGRVHVVLGNHEIMVMLGDLRYVHPKEQHVAHLHAIPYDRVLDVRTSLLGRWLASKPAVLRVGRVLIAHGGVTAAQARSSVKQLNDSLHTYMREDLFHRWADTTAVVTMDSASLQRRVDFFFDDGSLFWHRGYVQSDSLQDALGDVLRRLDADVLVVGHTARPTAEARYDGRVIAAHSTKYGAELVLLAKAGRTYERYRVGQEGAPIRF
jgi:predicted phosphodiesterase